MEETFPKLFSSFPDSSHTTAIKTSNYVAALSLVFLPSSLPPYLPFPLLNSPSLPSLSSISSCLVLPPAGLYALLAANLFSNPMFSVVHPLSIFLASLTLYFSISSALFSCLSSPISSLMLSFIPYPLSPLPLFFYIQQFLLSHPFHLLSLKLPFNSHSLVFLLCLLLSPFTFPLYFFS